MCSTLHSEQSQNDLGHAHLLLFGIGIALRGMQAEAHCTLHIARCTLLVASCCCTYLLFVVAVVMICDFFPHIDGHLAWVRPSPSPGIRSPPCPCPLSTVAAAGRNYATCRNFTQTEEEEEEEQIKQPSRRRSSYPSFLNSVKVPVTS